MDKIKNGDFIIHNGLPMIVRLERGKDEEGRIYCEWDDPESGDHKGDWLDIHQGEGGAV